MSELNLPRHEKQALPEPNEIWVGPEVSEMEPGFLSSLWFAIRGKTAPPAQIITLRYRLVLNRDLHTLFYFTPETDTRLHSAWLAEWLDWQANATRITDGKGNVLLSESELRNITGNTELPYGLEEKVKNR